MLNKVRFEWSLFEVAAHRRVQTSNLPIYIKLKRSQWMRILQNLLSVSWTTSTDRIVTNFRFGRLKWSTWRALMNGYTAADLSVCSTENWVWCISGCATYSHVQSEGATIRLWAEPSWAEGSTTLLVENTPNICTKKIRQYFFLFVFDSRPLKVFFFSQLNDTKPMRQPHRWLHCGAQPHSFF